MRRRGTELVLRVVRFVVRRGVEAGFAEYMRKLAENSIGTIDGLEQLELVRSVREEGVVVLGMSLWRDWEALEAFYADKLDEPLLFDPYREWVESASIEHFEHVLTSRRNHRAAQIG